MMISQRNPPLLSTSHLLFLVITAILTFHHCCCCLAIEIERTFLSGVADTTQTFSIPTTNTEKQQRLQQHHLACFHKASTYNNPYASTIEKRREKCCYELYQNGLIQIEEKQYCLDHVALVPPLGNNGAGGGSIARSAISNIMPVFYLAYDEEKIIESNVKEPTIVSYKQNRQLKVYKDKERETLRDGLKGRVDAFSPFHLTGFTTTPTTTQPTTLPSMLDLRGSVKGTLSEEGGMHRAFSQRAHFSLQLPGNSRDAPVRRYQVAINATILLPVTESIFIDADDALHVHYYDDNSPKEGVRCNISTLHNTNNSNFNSNNNGSNSFGSSSDSLSDIRAKCNIEFIHPETIDIEQPAFASRQYVVGYRISALLEINSPTQAISNNGNDNGNDDDVGNDGGGGKMMEVVIEYGTTLHIRYPSPIVVSSSGSRSDASMIDTGLVPVVIQQPVLYSASASCSSFKKSNEEDESDSDTIRYYTLAMDVSEHNPGHGSNHGSNIPTPSEPIVIHVAAGLDGDSWWVTVITMSAALMGGLILMRSLDSVSVWC